MTAPKAKFDPPNYLIISQMIEIVNAQTDSQKADELADMIAVCCQVIEDLGFNPVERFASRADAKGGEGFRGIYEKYRMKFGVILDEIREKEEALSAKT